ncbi:glycosyltransferase [Moorena producens 3L]|uniref:Glycosyltransferase n=3 Tax=Moorena TaxID=1155738 RepID=F4XV30_9CYAN|nr:glycosyltransferase [Moorena producens 3L]
METMPPKRFGSPLEPQMPTKTKRSYKVAIVHPSAGVNWSGGTENFAIELTHHLSPYFEVELLAGAPCSPFYYPAGGIPRTKARQILRNPLVNSVFRSVSTHPDMVIEHLSSFIPCAMRLLRKPADLIFPCNDYGGLAMAAFVRALIGTPILFKAHTGLTGGGQSLARSLRFCPNHLVVFSETMADFVDKQRPNQPVTIIPNGVDMDRFKPEGNQIDLGLNKPIVLCVASLNHNDHKRVELTIRAIAKLPYGSLLICGDGPDREYFQALGEELLGANRFAIQTFPFNQMPEVYRYGNLFTLPSIDEPFANAYLQAMSSGLGVVTTDDEIRRYMIGDAGIVCDVTNPDVYAGAIAQALSKDWKTKARKNGMRFSWDMVALRYRDLIMQMISQSSLD